MTLVQVKKLFRRCLLIAVTVVATGCASVKQMPSTPTAVGENSVVVTEQNAAQPDPLKDLITSLETKDVTPAPVSEKPDNDKLVQQISKTWNVPVAFAADVVKLADENAYKDFPKRNDILAIIAVESGFNRTAHHRGSSGLMQIQVKSHKKKLNGQNVYNPKVNMKIGTDILREYYLLLNQNVRGAVLSFNAGIGNFLKGRYKTEYLRKYKAELAKLPSS